MEHGLFLELFVLGRVGDFVHKCVHKFVFVGIYTYGREDIYKKDIVICSQVTVASSTTSTSTSTVSTGANDMDWFAGVAEEELLYYTGLGNADVDSLWTVIGSFVPPPPRPPYLPEEGVTTDGLTTCDLCTWALRNDRHSFSLDGTLGECISFCFCKNSCQLKIKKIKKRKMSEKSTGKFSRRFFRVFVARARDRKYSIIAEVADEKVIASARIRPLTRPSRSLALFVIRRCLAPRSPLGTRTSGPLDFFSVFFFFFCASISLAHVDEKERKNGEETMERGKSRNEDRNETSRDETP